jgi:K(+)-stimulated pyrophosphate-energized sodium pump
MNILIKLTCLIGLVMAPILGNGSHTISDNVMMHEEVSKQIMIEKSSVNGTVVGTVTTTVNGKVETQVFEGTDAEVQAKIDALK